MSFSAKIGDLMRDYTLWYMSAFQGVHSSQEFFLIFHFSGSPLPKVTWWKGSALYDSTDEVLRPATDKGKGSVPGTGLVVNRMVYRGLQGSRLGNHDLSTK